MITLNTNAGTCSARAAAVVVGIVGVNTWPGPPT